MQSISLPREIIEDCIDANDYLLIHAPSQSFSITSDGVVVMQERDEKRGGTADFSAVF